MPAAIIQLVKKKSIIRSLWQQTRYLAYKTELNKISKLLRPIITKSKEKMLGSFLEKLNSNETGSSSLWKTTKYVKYSSNSTLPTTKADGTWARTNKERAEVFADHYRRTFKSNTPNDEVYHTNHLDRNTNLQRPDSKLTPVSVNEIPSIIKRLSRRKRLINRRNC